LGCAISKVINNDLNLRTRSCDAAMTPIGSTVQRRVQHRLQSCMGLT
jgi:hypothetical protein